MKKEVVQKYNLTINEIDVKNPLTIGNGDFAMTFDVTTSQTFYDLYQDIPLTSMSNKNWFYKNDIKDVKLSYIDGKGYMLYNLNNEESFTLRRQYPFKYNFMHIILKDNGKQIKPENISNISQVLDLYEGIIESNFNYNNDRIHTKALIYQDHDELKYSLEGNLSVEIELLYPSYKKNGYVEDLKPNVILEDNTIFIKYDDINSLKLQINSSNPYKLKDNKICFEKGSVEFSVSLDSIYDGQTLSNFWEADTELIIEDERLVRRMILSKYLCHINASGIYPPSEAGLTFNNWNSKFHLEMHLIHSMWMIESNHIDNLLKSFDYYLDILPQAISRAKLNGYKGARFPKMTAPDGLDSPSNIGPLLIWQAPHILYFLQEIYEVTNDIEIIKKYEPLISNSVDFIISLFTLKDSKYQLLDPQLEACESIPVDRCINPTFELEYFRYVLQRQEKIDVKLYGKSRYNYQEFVANIIMPKEENDVYLKTYGMSYNDLYKDHPTEVFPYSFFVSDRLPKEKMLKTVRRVIKEMDLSSYWGWDFPFMGLCLLNCGCIEESIDIALMDKYNNCYLYNGHNTTQRNDLKIYLPANGAFLLYYHRLAIVLKNSLQK